MYLSVGVVKRLAGFIHQSRDQQKSPAKFAQCRSSPKSPKRQTTSKHQFAFFIIHVELLSLCIFLLYSEFLNLNIGMVLFIPCLPWFNAHL